MIEIYTDGSCNPVKNIGAWVAILFVEEEKIILKAIAEATTHNRMELTAVNEALEYLIQQNTTKEKILIYTDSQYVAQLPGRKEKLVANNYTSGKGKPIQNTGLVQKFYQLLEQLQVEFVKVKAHQKKTAQQNFNREADIMARKMLRGFLNLP
jgi:ribonuclease HI